MKPGSKVGLSQDKKSWFELGFANQIYPCVENCGRSHFPTSLKSNLITFLVGTILLYVNWVSMSFSAFVPNSTLHGNEKAPSSGHSYVQESFPCLLFPSSKSHSSGRKVALGELQLLHFWCPESEAGGGGVVLAWSIQLLFHQFTYNT